MTPSKIIIIAGPNGAGKTTFAREFLPQEAGCPVFVNADLKGSLKAIHRAALRARQVAQQTGTDLIVARAGQVVRVSPREQTTL